MAVDNIVKYLGIALQSADGSTVAASDENERHSEIDGSLTDGTRIYVTTRLNSDDKGEKTIYAIGE
ncbi:MAG: hypothetical protein AB8B50_04955 [Pirellulaceae bacterium]